MRGAVGGGGGRVSVLKLFSFSSKPTLSSSALWCWGCSPANHTCALPVCSLLDSANRGARGRLEGWRNRRDVPSLLLSCGLLSACGPCECRSSTTSSPLQWQFLPQHQPIPSKLSTKLAGPDSSYPLLHSETWLRLGYLLFGVWVLTSWAPSSELRDTSTSQASLPPQEPEFQLCRVPCLGFEALRILTSSFYSFSPGDGSCFLKLLHLWYLRILFLSL